jgi:hypothetical protein
MNIGDVCEYTECRRRALIVAIPAWILAEHVPITSAGHDRDPNLTQPAYIEGDP